MTTIDKDKVAEFVKRKAKREEARALEAERLAFERLELEDRLETELGPIGQAYQLVDVTALGEGLIAVRLGEEVLWVRFKGSKMTDSDAFQFVEPCLMHPTKEVFRAIAARRPEVVGRVSNALASLYGLKVAHDEGKF